ncbi:MAG TPA: periplasmic heavy metal sensor [Vicinamibacteria bacterium]|nr:periplasmic heavy metal sensor [Vicinamibacteria bacterium]
MQSRALISFGLAGALALAGARVVVAESVEGPTHGRGGPGGAARYLGLTAEQKTQFQQLHQAQRPQLQALGKQLHDNHQRLQDALAAANPDPAAVGAIVIEGHGLQQQMRKMRQDSDKAFRALLNPDQQVKFDALQALRHQRGPMGAMRGGGFGPPPGEEQ